MRAGVVIERWKLAIFTRHLRMSGYSYEEMGALTPDSLVLQVDFEPSQKTHLQHVISAAVAEAASQRRRP